MTYKYKKYGNSIKIKDSQLPVDKRFRPWPHIRKIGATSIKTFGDYYSVLSYLSVARIFNNAFDYKVFS